MKILKSMISISLLAACISGASADHFKNKDSHKHFDNHSTFRTETFYIEGRVVSATPIYERIIYRNTNGNHRFDNFDQNCRVREVEIRSKHSNGGPAGAIIGGAIGAHVGANAGHSRDSAIVGAIAGSVIGGVLGSEINHGDQVHRRVERDCDNWHRQETRELVGYDVRYRYNGREFTMQTQQHPGRYVKLQVDVRPMARY